MRLVVVCLLLAGCSAVSVQPDAPSGPIVQGEQASESSFVLHECTGVTTSFYFDGATARAAVPDPFVPMMLLGDRDGAYGELEHRRCEAELNGTSLGTIALALGGAWVLPPAHMTNGSLAVYVMRLATDNEAVAALFAWHGLPAEVAQLEDQSVWLEPGRGVHDTSTQGDRIIGVVADTDSVFSGAGSREWFLARGNVTRLTVDQASMRGDIAEAVVELDPAVWGTQTAANIFFSAYAADEQWKTAFDHFDGD